MSVHAFDNGVRVYERHLLPGQRRRYRTHNVHEPEEEAVFLPLLRALPQHAVFLNIGAAIGYYAILAKLTRPDVRVYVCEPMPRFRAALTEHTVLNGVTLDGVFPEAVGRERGEAPFALHAYASQLTSSPFRRKGVRAWLERLHIRRHATIRVPVVTLDDVLHRTGPVGLCAMDVQGSEADVLAGYSGRVPIAALLIGTHTPALHAECRRRVQALQYAVAADCFETAHQPDGILAAHR